MALLEIIAAFTPIEKAFYGSAAIVGTPLVFNLIKDIVRDYIKTRKERAYICMQLVFVLDKFIASCAEVAWDEGYDKSGPEPDDESLTGQVKRPVFDMSNVKGEYKYLKPDMLHRLYSIEIELQQKNDLLSQISCNPNFGTHTLKDYFMYRREQYGLVGLYVANICADIRKQYKIKKIDGWEPKQRIIDSQKYIQRQKSTTIIWHKYLWAKHKMISKN